jgi:hypothetical protein
MEVRETRLHQVIGIIGSEGVGKSSLARRFWDELHVDPDLVAPSAIIWWNFQSEPDADQFLHHALRYVTWEDSVKDLDLATSGNARAHQLGAAVATRRCLFVLDGLEAVQHHTGAKYGVIKNQDLRRFLEFLASTSNPSMGLLTSRIPLVELQSYTTYRSVVLGDLSLQDARSLLRKLGMQGSDEALDTVVTAWGGNPLVLSLLATLAVVRGGDIAGIGDLRLPADGQTDQGRVDHLLALHDEELTAVEQLILIVLASLRRPISSSELVHLSRTAARFHLIGSVNGQPQWTDAAAQDSVLSLEKRGLVRRTETEDLMMHPLVRQYYRALLAMKSPASVPLIHRLLADYYWKQRHFDPAELAWADLDHVSEAIHHECRAGDFYAAFELLTSLQLTHSEQGRTVLDRLGAHDTGLSIAREFFPDGDLSLDPMITDPEAINTIRAIAVHCLRAQGRPANALAIAEQIQRDAVEQEQGPLAFWEASLRLAELQIETGQLSLAFDTATQALVTVQRFSDVFRERAVDAAFNAQVSLAWAVLLQGDVPLAKQYFENSIDIVPRGQERIFHNRFRVRYAEHFRRSGDVESAYQMGNQVAEDKDDQPEVRAVALRLLADLHEMDKRLEPKNFGSATAPEVDGIQRYYDVAVEQARIGMDRSVLIDALQARGRWLARRGNAELAASDLWEALGYATEGGYRTLEADIRVGLAYERFMAEGFPAARAQATRALSLAEETGYRWGQIDAEAVLQMLPSAATEEERATVQEEQPRRVNGATSRDLDRTKEDLQAELKRVEQQYADIRRVQPAGRDRTLAMTEEVRKMIPLVSQMDDFTVTERLSAKTATGAERLAAYAYLFANPERAQGQPELIKELVETVQEPDPEEPERFKLKPFEQYWGLLALEKIVRLLGPNALDDRLREELRDLLRQLRPGGDRYRVLSGIIGSLDDPASDAGR